MYYWMWKRRDSAAMTELVIDNNIAMATLEVMESSL
jgi:hypothetical protein